MSLIHILAPASATDPGIERQAFTSRRDNLNPVFGSTILATELCVDFRPSLFMGGVLVLSGFIHLTLLWFTGAEWSGPLSLRKPGLFGVSAGVTVWSIAWVLTQLEQRRFDRLFSTLMASGLLIEVALITVQQWRGVASHFNRTTGLDATIESLMLWLITLVTIGIAWLCYRSHQTRPMIPSRAIAIRAGLWFLFISCVLGFLTMFLGEMNLASGHSPEVWGRAGVLKYPHGATLHAIQTLPLLSYLLQKLRLIQSTFVLRAAVVAHILFLVHSLWQTFSGRARTDVDATSLFLFMMAGVVILMLNQWRTRS